MRSVKTNLDFRPKVFWTKAEKLVMHVGRYERRLRNLVEQSNASYQPLSESSKAIEDQSPLIALGFIHH